MAETATIDRWRRPRDLVRGVLDFRTSIDSQAVWDSLAYRVPTLTTARTETVKLVLDCNDDEQVYFVNSRRWTMHEIFAMKFLDPTVSPDAFVTEMYRSPDRRFVLGSVLHYQEAGLWTVELDAGDTLDAARIERLVDVVAARLHIPADEVCYRPRSAHQAQAAAPFADRRRIVTGDDVNRSLTYQPLVTGSAVGYVRLLPGRPDLRSVGPRDIVVLDHVPDEIPPVAALVTGQFQAPLAHVAVLCRNRNTPDMSRRGAIESDELVRWADQLVRIEVDGQDFTITPVSEAEAHQAWEAIRPAPATIPPADLDVSELRQIDGLTIADSAFAGTKATGLSVIGALDGIDVPGGFVVPFRHYVDHLAAAAVAPPTDDEQLAEARRQIVETPVDAELLDRIEALLGEAPPPQILRSSTNAEDLEGFNGAGLYESIAVRDAGDRDALANALREVWASVWSDRAFAERDWYRIDHAAVAMAVIVQPLATPIDAIGVAVTHNPFNDGLPGMFINVQSADGSVTGATGDELPEQFLVHTFNPEYEIELLSRAAGRDREIMSDAEVLELSECLERIQTAIVPADRSSTFADVEFVLRPQGKRLLFLQARPYTVPVGGRMIWNDLSFRTRAELFVRPRVYRAALGVRRAAQGLLARRQG